MVGEINGRRRKERKKKGSRGTHRDSISTHSMPLERS
jgi:hypothetical protein